ncbi:MAG: FG-GAP repeat domain-containing protein, partial [Myxococcota bacterium]
MRRRRIAIVARLAALLVTLPGVASGDEEPFAVQQVDPGSRVVQAEIDDLDGDGHGDLVWTGVEGMPPDEERTLYVHFGADRRVPPAPDWSMRVPSGSAAYDLADVDGRPGAELLFLRRDRVTRISLHGRSPALHDLVTPASPTIAAVQDERGLDRLKLVRRGLGAEQRVLVPGMGQAFLLEPDGTPVATLEVGARANYFVPPRPGPLIAESEIEIYFDHPRLETGDVDGDGRLDLLASDRHALHVFLQREDGGFDAAPSRTVAFGKLTLADHIRSSGSVRVMFHDFDADGRIDLLLAASTGSIFG